MKQASMKCVGEWGRGKDREIEKVSFLLMCGWNLRASLVEMIEENVDCKDYPKHFSK